MGCNEHAADAYQFKLNWEKDDSHIERWVYKSGARPCGNKYSIRLNKMVDIWAGGAREWGDTILQGVQTEQFFYPENQVMVQLKNRYIYGNIINAVREDITKDRIITYLLGKIPIGT